MKNLHQCNVPSNRSVCHNQCIQKIRAPINLYTHDDKDKWIFAFWAVPSKAYRHIWLRTYYLAHLFIVFCCCCWCYKWSCIKIMKWNESIVNEIRMILQNIFVKASIIYGILNVKCLWFQHRKRQFCVGDYYRDVSEKKNERREIEPLRWEVLEMFERWRCHQGALIHSAVHIIFSYIILLYLWLCVYSVSKLSWNFSNGLKWNKNDFQKMRKNKIKETKMLQYENGATYHILHIVCVCLCVLWWGWRWWWWWMTQEFWIIFRDGKISCHYFVCFIVSFHHLNFFYQPQIHKVFTHKNKFHI